MKVYIGIDQAMHRTGIALSYEDPETGQLVWRTDYCAVKQSIKGRDAQRLMVRRVLGMVDCMVNEVPYDTDPGPSVYIGVETTHFASKRGPTVAIKLSEFRGMLLGGLFTLDNIPDLTVLDVSTNDLKDYLNLPAKVTRARKKDRSITYAHHILREYDPDVEEPDDDIADAVNINEVLRGMVKAQELYSV